MRLMQLAIEVSVSMHSVLLRRTPNKATMVSYGNMFDSWQLQIFFLSSSLSLPRNPASGSGESEEEANEKWERRLTDRSPWLFSVGTSVRHLYGGHRIENECAESGFDRPRYDIFERLLQTVASTEHGNDNEIDGDDDDDNGSNELQVETDSAFEEEKAT
ncbi:GL16528 [Drosophila persimilis]|uniref:GL16528 n=1 Tax=Drosophila persimilis TaxID=7234 RepID=B4GWC1_DROPE|nr:GL16528 [Drosophila persimilis]